MLTRLLSAAAIWMFIVGCCVALGERAEPAAPSMPTQPPAAPEPVRFVPDTRPESSFVLGMQTLERQVRVGTILYTGRFGQPDPAANRLPAIALTVGGATR
jgi:hypothetical protein